MMKQRISIFLLFTLLLFANGYAQKGIMRLTQQTLMHEVRENAFASGRTAYYCQSPTFYVAG